MNYRNYLLSVVGGLGLATASAQALTVVNFEPPTYTAGEHLNSGQDGWVHFGSADGAVTPDTTSGYTYPALSGTQSFALFTNAGGYAHGWGAAASQIADGVDVSWLTWVETNTGANGGPGMYMMDDMGAGSTPIGLQFNESTQSVQLFGAGGFTNTSLPWVYHVNYKVEMELDFTLDQFNAYLTDVTHGGARTLLGTKPFYYDMDAGIVASSGGMYFEKATGSPYMIDDFAVTLPQPGWKNDGSGDWLDARNWQGDVPNAVGAAAIFPNVISSPQTVYTNAAVTVGSIRFDSPSTFVLAGAGSLTIQTSSGNGSVSVLQGSHKINLPLIFASSTDIAVAGGATLTIGNPTTIKANQTVTKTGTVQIEAPLTLEAGATLVTAGGKTTLFGAPSLGSGAKIDLKNTALTVDYRGQVSPASTIKGQIAGSAIMSSSATSTTGLGWKDDAASQSILVKYTYLGDTNLDGQVDVIDLGNLATAWQTAGVWVNGDSNYDDFVDVIDLGLLATNWQAGVGSPLGPGSLDQALAAYGLPSVSVPEPASIGLIGLMGGLVLSRKRRN